MKRRLGQEVFERIGQPMIGGIYGGNPEKLSLRATVPQFEEMEKKYGSVIRGLGKQQDNAHETASGPRYSLFLSMKQGMELQPQLC
jgi:oxygen-dependent protoporphyrinogen oxidase